MKKYAVREIFATIQGEGARAGTPAVFVRLIGCNLWDGKPEHRDRGAGACARWCDTDFVSYPLRMTAAEIAGAVAASSTGRATPVRNVVVTGGEPLLQVDEEFIDAFDGLHLAVETNGTIDSPVLQDIDWVTVSPKLGSMPLQVLRADEYKVVLPGVAEEDDSLAGWSDSMLIDLFNRTEAEHYIVQPQDPIMPQFVEESHLRRAANRSGAFATKTYEDNLARCVEFALNYPQWSVGLQLHKLIRMP